MSNNDEDINENNKDSNENNSSGLTNDEYDTLHDDVEQAVKKANDQHGYGGGPQELSVSEALRIKKGHYRVIGQIITISSVYNMITATNLKCLNCGTVDRRDYKKPIYALPTRGPKCINCSENTVGVEPEWITVVDVELQDNEKFNEIEHLHVKLFEDNTIDLRAGEIVAITGELNPDRKSDGRGKYFTILYSESIEYTRREKVELTKQDIEDIEAWKKSIQDEGKQNVIEALVQKFEPTVTGNEFAKKALLLAGVNAGIKNDDSRDPRRLRINVILVGDPSLAKSVLMRKIVTLLPNARYESAQGSTGISLTFMVSKENDSHILRLGPIPLANGSLCAINEMGQMPLEQQRHFLDFAEEGQSTNNKHGIHAHIIGNTSLIGSANPYGGRWKHPNEIGLDEIPILSQIIERTDMLIVFRETQPDRQKDREYVNAINKIRRNNKIGRFSGYDEFLKKYLMYARTFNPGGEISEDALNMIDEYWIEMSQRGVLGQL